MDTLKDIWASMVAGVQERTTNPLTFSFIASWCLWNYKFFFILAGDGTTAARLQAVDALYPCIWTTYARHAFGFPFLTACAYVFLYPSLSVKVIDYYRRKQVAIANTVREIEGARLLTVEDANRLTRSHEADRAVWQEKESALLTQLHEIRRSLASSEKQATQDNNLTPNKSPASSAQNLSVDIIKELSNYTGLVSLSALASNLKKNPTLIKIELQALREQGLVTDDDYMNWGLTEEGDKFAVDLLHQLKSTSS